MAAKMKDMALTDSERGESMMPVSGDAMKYPYGLCICLGQDELDKLGADHKSLTVGDMINLDAIAKVTSISSNDTGDGEKGRVELQICYLGTELEEDNSGETSYKPSAPKPTKLYKQRG